jgi:PmbA protein
LISTIEHLSYRDSTIERVVANTKGVLQHDISTKFSVSVSVVARDSGSVETGEERAESTFFEDLDRPSKIASRASWKATSLLGGQTPPTQTVPVILDRDVGHALLAHFFAMVNGENVANHLSALEGRIGDTIGSPLVTIVDDATIGRCVGSRGFDDEGTPSRKTVVMEKGVLKSFLFDARAGRKSRNESTGNAKRRDLRTLPSVGYTNLFVEKGTVSPDEIIGSTETGLWIVSLAGWWVGINPSTGDFSSGAKGLWVDRGEVTYPVKNVTVASNALDMLAAIDMVGDDLHLRHESASPTLRISEMKIGGR